VSLNKNEEPLQWLSCDGRIVKQIIFSQLIFYG
jgi:hypothetical protein